MNTSKHADGNALRFRSLLAMGLAFAALNIATRIYIYRAFADDFQGSPASAGTALLLGGKALLLGFINDCAAFSFILIPLMLFVMLPTANFFQKRAGRIFLQVMLLIFSLIIVFTAFAEYFFWDEFHTRFNFIAVDYLIYTSEVINNIQESYPLRLLLPGIFAIALLLTLLLWKFFIVKGRALSSNAQASPVPQMPFLKRTGIFCATCLVAGLVFLVFSPQTGGGTNRYWRDLASNGAYELFSAFRHNRIDYRAFYPLMDKTEAFALLRGTMVEPGSSFVTEAPEDLRRNIKSPTPAAQPNVVIVVMESFGSKWLGEYSPNLTRLSQEGLFLSQMRSTGTRTVRGLEAITLSVPPTPGNSIVRRPKNGGLFSIGTVFEKKGYDRAFIYGGYGYFDNMNAFFTGNGYRVVDRTDFKPEQCTFATAWGQCDEDLFSVSLSEADAVYNAGKPFHQVVLTTSNHRPFTYPDGKVSLPSGGSRRGAVQYSDYSIGQFMEKAAKKPWFDNTIFIFVGDHPSAIAGKTDIPTDGYGVACIFYWHGKIQAQDVSTVCSQIDIAPTLFALMGWDYRTQFFGRNVLTMPPEEGRAWISTYQLLGFMNQKGLAVLRPAGKPDWSSIDVVPLTEEAEATPSGPWKDALIQRAIASYQCAYDLFMEGKMKADAVVAP